MNSDQLEQLSRFKTLTRWMYEDAKRAMFPPSNANFVVATAVFNYIEALGMFLIGTQSSTQSRFHAFFDYMGNDYKNLRKNNSQINFYDELRCGLTHEGLPKNRRFCIYGADKYFNDDSLRSGLGIAHILLQPNKQRVTCGIIFNGSWHVVLGKLIIDFQDAIQRLIGDIENGRGSQNAFFKAASHINLANFIN